MSPELRRAAGPQAEWNEMIVQEAGGAGERIWEITFEK